MSVVQREGRKEQAVNTAKYATGKHRQREAVIRLNPMGYHLRTLTNVQLTFYFSFDLISTSLKSSQTREKLATMSEVNIDGFFSLKGKTALITGGKIDVNDVESTMLNV